jgi:hypothetical protein
MYLSACDELGRNPLMCRHPFPFELLTHDQATREDVSQSDAVLGSNWPTGGAASRSPLPGVISIVMAAAVALVSWIVLAPLF